MQTDSYITLGVITNVHGINGTVKVKSFTANPEDIFTYTPLVDENGREVVITKIGTHKDTFLATAAGCHTRTDAERLKGTELCVLRSQLPPLSDGEYYNDDLVGCAVVASDNTPLGMVKNMHNYGAGDLVEVTCTSTGKSELFLFAHDVQSVDVDNRIIVLQVPTYLDMKQHTHNDRVGTQCYT